MCIDIHPYCDTSNNVYGMTISLCEGGNLLWCGCGIRLHIFGPRLIWTDDLGILKCSELYYETEVSGCKRLGSTRVATFRPDGSNSMAARLRLGSTRVATCKMDPVQYLVSIFQFFLLEDSSDHAFCGHGLQFVCSYGPNLYGFK